MSDKSIIPDDLTPQFISADEEAYYRDYVLGNDAIQFLNSDLGRVIRGMADQDRREAAEKLLVVDPDDTKQIRAIQLKAMIAECIPSYLKEIISRQEIAEQILKEYRD